MCHGHESCFPPLRCFAFSFSCCSLKVLSIKTALLLALTAAKRVCELAALLVHPSCSLLHCDYSRATFRPSPSSVPKNIRRSFRSRVVQLDTFCLPPHAWDREAKLHLLCPVCALDCYVERMAQIRHTEQLFMCFQDGVAGKAL